MFTHGLNKKLSQQNEFLMHYNVERLPINYLDTEEIFDNND